MYFIVINNRLINTKYIKEITKNQVVIANTNQSSTTGAGFTEYYKHNLDEIIEISSSEYKLIIEQISKKEQTLFL